MPISEVCEYGKVEQEKGRGRLGCDDLYIKIDGVVQVQFCHHSHLHLQYDQEDLPLVKDLNTFFAEKIGQRP